jgi:hypothetical protein
MVKIDGHYLAHAGKDLDVNHISLLTEPGNEQQFPAWNGIHSGSFGQRRLMPIATWASALVGRCQVTWDSGIRLRAPGATDENESSGPRSFM